MIQFRLPSLALAALLSGASFAASGQTVADFEEIILAPETDFASSLSPDSSYHFVSGGIRFAGETNAWGSFYNFNVSNTSDTSDVGFLNDVTAITGRGAGTSSNYAVCFINIDFLGPNPDRTIPAVATWENDTSSKRMVGAYVTNTSYAYHYMASPSFAAAGHWYQLIVRGYEHGLQKQDSVVFYLADFRNNLNHLVDDWEWLDLSALGAVDSLSFDVASDDKNAYGLLVPAYFAIDQLTWTTNCPSVETIAATEVTDQSAVLRWAAAAVDSFEVAIDESMTLAPDVNTAVTFFTNADSILLSGLNPATPYVFHIRRVCGDAFSDWDTTSFQTLTASSIAETGQVPSIRIFPNPVQDVLEVSVGAGYSLTVFSMLGEEVAHEEGGSRIGVGQLPPGSYLLRIIDPKTGRGTTHRFVKQ